MLVLDSKLEAKIIGITQDKNEMGVGGNKHAMGGIADRVTLWCLDTSSSTTDNTLFAPTDGVLILASHLWNMGLGTWRLSFLFDIFED